MADVGKQLLCSGEPIRSTVFTRFVQPSVFEPASESVSDLPDSSSIDGLIASSKVKRLIRTTDWPVCHEIRRCLWLKLCNASFDCKVVCDPTAYQEAVQSVFGEGQ